MGSLPLPPEVRGGYFYKLGLRAFAETAPPAASRWQTVCLGLTEPARRVFPRTDNSRHVFPHTQAHTISHNSTVHGPCPATPVRAHQGPQYSQSQRPAGTHCA